VSRIPQSLIISEGSPVGDNGNSWTILVFILYSQLNDALPGDEDQIPPNGNPHPMHEQHNNDNPNLGILKMWVTWITFRSKM
jgi:hypothetical protein